ncbi:MULTISPECIES: DUF3809 domain-containing protein [Deinococcus]|uniref:DUF3809 domain-containing protein n=1 Tax=Deinococcus rufus TaxID=2136097 RepID=A0ABV7Z422_9DEIO|nr:DUF3809 domain-containing protein [Deinococcus sp. AB2017081]WQE96011.1 DUF3809 domain-containing protein [Deinococcus sp. AB2017081]
MVIESAQAFTLTFPGPSAGALAFVRSPAWALSRVEFLRHLRADDSGVRGELLVQLPVLGQADLPFHSRVVPTADGAALEPQPLSGERAWVEVQGSARAEDTGSVQTALDFSFMFRAHLAVPDGGGWGGDAFSKMVQAAARRTLERVARELPAGIAAAMADAPAAR